MVETAPLSGITVLEICSNLAGPFAGKVLVELGAQVIKVEPSDGGDVARHWGKGKLGDTSAVFQTFNKEKRSLSANLRDPDQVAALLDLIEDRIDVVFQNLRPGLVDKYGLGPDAVLARKPEVIYCNLGAYGEGPLASLPGYDPLIQAFTGVAATTGETGGRPSRVGVPVVDMGTGMWAVIGILAALLRRGVTGRGGLVDASLFETGLAWMSMAFAFFEADGDVPERRGLRGPIVAPNGEFETADGLLMITTASESQFVPLCEALGMTELLDDPRFATGASRYANDHALIKLMNQRLRTKSRAHWAERLDRAGVPNAPLQDLAQAVAHEQTAASGILQSSTDGGYRVVGLPLKFDGVRPAHLGPAPALGEADEELL